MVTPALGTRSSVTTQPEQAAILTVYHYDNYRPNNSFVV
jgi:hypothetical protein